MPVLVVPGEMKKKRGPKERIFSVRDDFGQWDAKKQRPELFDMLNGKINVW
jgi:sulfate adenylyltransferase subunit 2